ncbi:YopX family protein [Alkalihalophilus pseudofirmus]|uniref:YopX family protein n=1 Tax=Alkalihalophilus pseudofirmus TaxID=79885 RepID=UPI00259B6315|nr:YopX family protein [Alkalihalophilus pseudofirmus]WEG18624.1 YopX family protein [Alkalihalophilus pseudofirmus]
MLKSPMKTTLLLLGEAHIKNEKVIWETSGLEVDQECELMQFTGYKDKNNKMIYEGDILEGSHYPISNEDDYYLVVDYAEDRFWGVRRLSSNSSARGISNGMADGLYEFSDQDLEVVGNIYEDSELLVEEVK